MRTRAAVASAPARAAAAAHGRLTPAAPSPPPPPPPPAPYFQQRGRDTETDYDPDCEIVSYATCRGIVADYAREHGTADVLRVSFAPCEGLDLDEGCYRGCSYGGANGGYYHDLLPDMLAEFNASNPRRCKLSELPYCACANKPTVYHTFPPPPPITYTEDYHAFPAYTEGEHVIGGGAEGVFDAEQGQASALVKRVSNVHTIDLALRSSHRTLACPGRDDGEMACARNCAAEHLTALRAFTVTGAVESPSLPPSAAPTRPRRRQRRRTSPSPSARTRARASPTATPSAATAARARGCPRSARTRRSARSAASARTRARSSRTTRARAR